MPQPNFQEHPSFPTIKTPLIDFKLEHKKFVYKGLNLNKPVDFLEDGDYSIALNVRSYQQGRIETRPGLTLVGTVSGAGDDLHSIRRLNDDTPGATNSFLRIVGAGTSAYAGQTVFTSLEAGFSGSPLSMISHRPSESPQPWLYIGDSNKMRKVNSAKTIYQMGIAPPRTAPSAALAQPIYKIIDNMDATTGWVGAGAAFDGGTGFTVPDRVNTTIAAILFDSGSTGPCSIKPTTFSQNFQPGQLVKINSGGGTEETVEVEEVFNPIFSTTIASIIYDSGTTGPCSIQLTTPTEGIKRNMMLFVAAAEYVRVLSVTEAPTGIVSFRCSTASTRAATNAVAGVASIRVNTTSTHAAAETLTGKSLQFGITALGTTYITKTGALDLSNTGGRPIQPDDLVHVSFKFSSQAILTEGQVQFDIDRTTPFQNYLFKPFRPSDLTAAVDQTTPTLSVQQQVLQRQEIDRAIRINARQSSRSVVNMGAQGEIGNNDPQDPLDAGVYSNQATSGDDIWFEFTFPVKELERVGSDESRTLLDVAAIRLSFTTTGAITINVDDWWIGGTYGPYADPLGEPIQYCYIGRSSATGARSNPSPPLRNGVSPNRQRVVVTVATYDTTSSGDPQVDKLDIFRTGSTLLQWYYIGTVANPSNAAATTATFNDDYPDETLFSNDILEFDNFQPFPSIDIPRSGTCTVSGTTVTRVSGDTFNTSWAQGTIIQINGIAYTTYAQPASTSLLELNESAGSQTAVSWSIPAAIILGQPLPNMWGPFGGGEFGVFFFACGDNRRSGTLYWTKGNDPDSAPDTNCLEITSPSEPLMNGCVFDGAAYVFSSEKLYVIKPNFTYASAYSTVGDSQFTAQLVNDSMGLYTRWGLAAGEFIYFIGKDGIYKTDGGAEVASITDESLRPIFPHDGQPGVETNGVLPPDFSHLDQMQLECYDGRLYFDYLDTNGSLNTLIYDEQIKAWSLDQFAKGGASIHYGEEGDGIHNLLIGCADGKLYSNLGTTDAGSTIGWHILTPYFDAGDPRSRKIWAEMLLDIDAPSGLTQSISFDNGDSTTTPAAVAATTGRDQVLLDISSGLGTLTRNIALELNGGGAVKLYGYSPSYLTKPEDTKQRATDWDDENLFGAKFVQGCLIEADTFGVDKPLQIQYDGGTVGATLVINHNGQIEKPYSFPVPFVGHSMRLVSTDATQWRLHRVRYIYEPVPESTQYWITQGTTFNMTNFSHLRDGYVTIQSSDVVTFVANGDGTDYTIATIPSTSGVHTKVYFTAPPVKAKVWSFKLTSPSGFRLYMLDSSLHVKQWGSSEDYTTQTSFGDLSRQAGALI